MITKRLLLRAWAIMGLVSAVLVLGAFFAVLFASGWRPGADTAEGAVLHDVYLQATTATFLAIVACQLGTVFAARAERASLRSGGPHLQPAAAGWGGFRDRIRRRGGLPPPLQAVFGTAALPAWAVTMMLPFPVIVWGADEIYRWLGRRGAA